MNFKNHKNYTKWLRYIHSTGLAESTPGNQSVSIAGKKKNVKHENGGELEAVAPDLIGMGLNMALPGLGSVVSPLVGMAIQKSKQSKALQDHFNSMSNSTNPYGNYEHGGVLNGHVDSSQYLGLSHNAGGIATNQDGVPSNNKSNEMENGEYKVQMNGGVTMIFSKKLTV